MSSKQQDVAKSNISPVLFMTVDGEPMSFFLRPGPVKLKLQPLIAAGGGMSRNVQQPGVILLIDPEEIGSIPENTAQRYVSTQYIHDCIEKEEQLNLEDYRLNPVMVTRQSARLNNNKETSPGVSGGRTAYTAEDDAAILSHVSKHKKDVGGNRLWQEMEKQRVTDHSWQSMKYRYRVRLSKKQPEVVEVAKTEMDAQSIPAESTQLEILETPTSISPQEEVKHVNPQMDKQEAESPQVETVEAETSNSPQPEGPCLDPHTDAQPVPAEGAEPETIISPQKESVSEDFPPAQLESLPSNSSQKKPKDKQKASPKAEQPQRRLTRRQLVLEESSSPEPYVKKLRSTTSPGLPASSPQPSKKSKSEIKSALTKTCQEDLTEEQPPAKRARGMSVTAVAESPQEESGQAAVSETAQTVPESNVTPEKGETKGEKKKEKRKLGILELATKEFEDESESDEEVVPDLQSPTETAATQPTSTEPPLPTSDTASLQENTQDAQASSSDCPPKTSCPEPAAAEAVNATSKAHLFIFDNESQEEEDSQTVVGDNKAAPSKPQLTVNKDAALSLTQVQLEEDKQRIKELMNQTNQDLISVTKALLKTSGDFSAALDQLLNPSSVIGPPWNRCDDSLLLSADPVVRQQLQNKYSEEDVAKRILFLEVDLEEEG
ncbi:LOW QUALITY PROTEIN: telomeric repeat-binding factor 2-interacting protein 1 [Cottoperca gobio]|uniref:Telomeric repeat-binding factor 2-interacting protein 1 n=1 Tax=Cottoperca gobio TaxID=56716 RepID=A0A6J2PNE6_COTGO|nr:LOW QUALITY PROTEIN: telomeric repeat-binding factor 2-interacting protein 1 [Cottoperca gobio]